MSKLTSEQPALWIIAGANGSGKSIRLIYVFLRSVELNIERVRIRVKKGGHNVDPGKIKARRERSFEQLPWFMWHADTAQILDNSGATPELVAVKDGERLTVYGRLIPEVRRAIDIAAVGRVGR